MLPYEHWICQVHLSLPKWLNQWKGYAFAIIFNGSFQRIRVCGTEVLLILLLIPMSINRTRGMNDKLRRKVKPRRNNGFTSLNRCEFIAGSLKLCRSRRFKYRSADPPPICNSVLTALTMASTFSFVISWRTIVNGINTPPLLSSAIIHLLL